MSKELYRFTDKVAWGYAMHETLLYQAREKLGKLEDLEEKLGIELVELFGLVGKDIYFKQTSSREIQKERVMCFEVYNLDTHLTTTEEKENHRYIYNRSLSDLNKTWFLTEEEAKKALEEKK